jgi:segregation and condensation protein B
VTDERSQSLAAQAAAWVPPWERPPREPDRAYQAAATDPDLSDDLVADDIADANADDLADADADADDLADADADDADEVDADAPDADAPEADEPDSDEPEPAEPAASAGGEPVREPDDDEQLDEAGLADDDDFDPAFEGGPAPLPGETSEPVTVDDPAGLPGDSGAPTDVRVGPDLPVPASIEQAGEMEDDEETGNPVDAPLLEGDDAGEVFDQAADDDVSDDAEVDLPFEEDEGESDEDAEDGLAEDEREPDEDAEDGPAEDDRESDEDAEDGPARDDREPDEDAEDGLAEDEREPDEDAEGGLAEEGRAQDEREPARHAEDALATGGRGAGHAGGDAGRDPGSAVGDSRDGTSVAAGAAIPAQSGPGREPAAASGDQNARTDDDLDVEPPPMDDAELRGALESVLLVVDEPVAEMQLAQILEQPTERVAAMLEDISARYTAAGHGFDLRRAAGGWRLYTRPEYAAYVERFVLDGQSVRLTQAALETLAVVAYKQPVTRSRISAIRGVNCDGVMRTLATRGLIEDCGTEPETGAHLYRTTTLFLEKLGLNSVDQLPPLAPFLPDDVEEVLDASG